MTVRHEVRLSVLVSEGQAPTEVEASLIEHIAWVNQQGPYSSAYHEVMAHIALTALRHHWERAALFRELEERAAQRRARGKRPRE